MITTSNKPAYTYLRRLSGLVLMILITTTMALSVQHAEAQTTQPKKKVIEVLNVTPKASTKSTESPAKDAVKKEKDIKISISGDADYKEEAITLSPDSNTKNPPLYILDGKEMTAVEMKKVDADKIATVNVLKGEAATLKYGAKAKYGVVEIYLKKDNEPASDKDEVKVTIPKNVIYYLDGKLSSKKEVDKISPENIATINILKGEKAMLKYGKEANEGVIEIMLKKAVN